MLTSSSQIFQENKREADNTSFWIGYADLMTALTLLFLILMSISIVSIAFKPENEAEARRQEINHFLTLIETAATDQKLTIKIDKHAYTLSFDDKVNFPHDKYTLQPKTAQHLQRFVKLLLNVYANYQGKQWLEKIHIEGFTDETGTYLYNVGLSLRRAQAVVCAMFATNLNGSEIEQLQQLIVIDGASITSIQATQEESRRVQVRFEFLRPSEEIQQYQPHDIALGQCEAKFQPQ